jgi:hypothetical protein
MGALLLPEGLTRKAIASLLSAQGTFEQPRLPADRREEAIRVLADTFDVNPVVARIRIESLYPPAADLQLTL